MISSLLMILTYAHSLAFCETQSATTKINSNIQVGEYEILSLVGKGGKSEVFKAVDRLGNFVAIKRMLTKKELKSSYPDYYLAEIFDAEGKSLLAARELWISEQINHPNIIKVRKIFFQKDKKGNLQTYLIMDFVNGKTLAETSNRSHTKARAFKNALTLIDALIHMAEHHFFDEDTYRSNFMFTSDDKIKIIDLTSFEYFFKVDTQLSFDDISHRKYAKTLLMLIRDVLACGDFEKNEVDRIYDKMNSIKYRKEFEERLDEPLRPNSSDFFIPFLNEIVQVLSQLDRVPCK